MFLFGALVHRLIISPALDKPHLVVVFATMGLSIFMQNVALMVMTADLLGRAADLAGRSFTIGPFYFKVELLLGFAVAHRLHARAAMDDRRRPISARRSAPPCRTARRRMLMGIPVPRIFLITFAAGSALVGLAACVMMPLFSVFPTVGLNFVLIAFVIVVLGGMGSIEGALLGGICIGVVQSVSSYYIAPAFGQMFFFILFLLVMIFRPDGLLGQKGRSHHRHQRLRAGWMRRRQAAKSTSGLPAAAGARHASRCSRLRCWWSASRSSRLPCRKPAGRRRPDLPVGRARAGLEHRRRLCRADFVRARGVLRHRRLYLDASWSANSA